MILNLSQSFDRKKFATYSESLLNKQAVVEIKEKKQTRTLAQNNYLHLLLGYFATETGYDLETVKHDIFKKIVNKDTFVRHRESKYGVNVTYIRSTKDLDTGEMSLCIDRFRDYSARAGLYLPDVNEHDALIEAEKQIELCQRYL